MNTAARSRLRATLLMMYAVGTPELPLIVFCDVVRCPDLPLMASACMRQSGCQFSLCGTSKTRTAVTKVFIKKATRTRSNFHPVLKLNYFKLVIHIKNITPRSGPKSRSIISVFEFWRNLRGAMGGDRLDKCRLSKVWKNFCHTAARFQDRVPHIRRVGSDLQLPPACLLIS